MPSDPLSVPALSSVLVTIVIRHRCSALTVVQPAPICSPASLCILLVRRWQFTALAVTPSIHVSPVSHPTHRDRVLQPDRCLSARDSDVVCSSLVTTAHRATRPTVQHAVHPSSCRHSVVFSTARSRISVARGPTSLTRPASILPPTMHTTDPRATLPHIPRAARIVFSCSIPALHSVLFHPLCHLSIRRLPRRLNHRQRVEQAMRCAVV